jgi:glycosyltransferase involved in cell wall biosynthesis
LLSRLVQCDPENQYTFVVDSDEQLEGIPAAAEIKIVRTNKPTAEAAAADGRRSAMDLVRMSWALSCQAFKIVLFPTAYSYVPVLSKARKVVVIHDVIAETFPHLTLPRRVGRIFWDAKLAASRWQADAIVTVSEYSRQGLARQFKLPLERIAVVGEASDTIFHPIESPPLTTRLRELGVSNQHRMIAYVGGFGPHKNLDALVTVFARLASRPGSSDLRLIMVGQTSGEAFYSHAELLKQRITELELTDRVIFTGFLPDSDLAVLLNLSTVLTLPSLMEGFGLPAVEAAACGCPVIATTSSPLPELLGDGGIYVDPTNWDELEDALNRVLASPELRRRMREAGRAAAAQLSWDAAALQMKRVLHEVGSR